MAGIIGVDIGTRAVKVVSVEGSAKRLRLTGFAVKHLSSGASPEAVKSAVDEALRSVSNTSSRPSDRVVVALPTYDAVVREFSMPFSDESRIRSTLKFEIESKLPFHIDDVVTDYVRVDQSEDTTDLVVCAVRKDAMGSTLELMNSLKIDPVAVDLDICGLLNVAAQADLLPEEGSALLMDIGWIATKMSLVTAGQIRQFRAVRIGLSSIIGEVRAATGVDPESAEKIVEDFAKGVVDIKEAHRQAAESASGTVLSRLCREAKRFAAMTTGSTKVSRTLLTGGGSRLPGVVESLSEAIGGEVLLLDPTASLPHSLSNEAVEELGKVGCAALGMALKDVGFDQASLNFRQEEFVYRSGFERIRTPLSLCLIVLLLLFGGVGWFMHGRASARCSLAGSTEAAMLDIWKKVRPGRPVPADIPASLGSMLRALKDGDGTSGGQESALDMWLTVANTFPADVDVEFSRIEMKSTGATLRGETAEGSGGWKRILSTFEQSTTLKAVQKNIYTTQTGLQFTLEIYPDGGI